MTFRSPDVRCALGAGALMFALWAGAPGLLGVLEPWDTAYPLYSTAALLAGAALGYLSRGALLGLFLGAWLGQILALAVLPGHDRSWLFLGLLTTALGSLIALAGGAIGALLRKRASG